MMTPEDARTLFAYDAWANQRVLDACAALAPEQFTQRPGVELSLGARHHGAHHGRASGFGWSAFRAARRSAAERRSVPGSRRLAKTLGARWSASFWHTSAALSAADLERELRLSGHEGQSAQHLLWQTLQHLANHSTYHRGQVTTLFAPARRQTGRHRPHRLLPRTRRRRPLIAEIPRRSRVEVIHTVEWMKQVARQARAEGRLVGFVPTMGALHAGHLSLIEAARREASPVAVSIFVNPKQFGPSEDFANYPRDSRKTTAQLLEQAGVDFLFAPPLRRCIPPGFRTSVNVEGLADRLEGKIRPGHFRGVATVVLKLLEIVAPRFAYFGRKDAQQARIIRQMALDLALDSEIMVCPIVREPDGLALSSRNRYLSPAERSAATVLYRALSRARRAIEEGERDTLRIVAAARQELAGEPLASVDYVEMVDAGSFETVVRLRGLRAWCS